MNTGFALIAMGVGVLLYTYACMATHHLHWDNDRSALGALSIVGVGLVIIGLILNMIG